MNVVGIDVAKDTLMCFGQGRCIVVKNRISDIRRYLKGLSVETVIGIEATSTYHLALADEAHDMGFTVYALNPVDAARYRQALHGRGKTDMIDAEMIARFVSRERDTLRPYEPLSPELRRLRNLLKRRDKVMKAKVMLEMSLSGEPELKRLGAGALRKLVDLLAKLDRLIDEVSRTFDGHEQLASIPSIGVLNTGALLAAFHAGKFPSADAFVAYCGLDCRPRESGSVIGKRRISRRGSSMLRKHLYMAAMGGCILPAWKDYYQAQLAKGLQRIQAIVALARKIARTAWSIFTHRAAFRSERISCQIA